MYRTLILVLLLACGPISLSHAENGNIDELINFSKKQTEALIVKVVKSDLVVLENGQKIKLIGIESAGDPPKQYKEIDPNDPQPTVTRIEKEPTAEIPSEAQALTYARELMEGKHVKLEFDNQAFDEQGYKLAYIFLPDGQLANAQLLRQGMVNLKIRIPNVKYENQMRQAYQQAKHEQRGFLSY